MANIPAGTGEALLTEEQKELVVRVSNSDFNSVIETTLARIESFLSSKPSIPSNPTSNDIISLAGNLSAVVPAGFLLIHDDLQKLKGGDGEDASSSTGDFSISVVSLLTPMLVGAGAAVVAAGIVKGLFGGFSSSTTNHVQDLVDGLNERLTVDDLAGDSAVLTAQKIGFIAYMEAYFLQQAASLVVSGTLQAVGEGAGKAVRGFFTSLFGKQVEEDTVTNKLKSIVEDIIEAQTSDKYMEDPSVTAAVKVGIIGYMVAYFATQTTAMAADTLVTNLASTAGTAVNKLITGLLGLDNDPKSYSHIQGIVDDLIEGTTKKTVEDDEKVKDAISSGLAGYIKTYFIAQATAMATDTIAVGASSTAATGIKTFFTTLFGKEEESPSDELSNHISELSTTLITDATEDTEDVKKWEEIQTAIREGLSSYIKVYFASQALAMAGDTVVTNAASTAGKAINNFFTSLFGKKSQATDDPLANKLITIIDIISKNLNAEKLANSSEVSGGLEEGIKEFARSYVNTMSESLISQSKSSINTYAKDAWDAYKSDKTTKEAPKQFFSRIISSAFSLTGFPSTNDFSSIKKQVALDTAEALLTAEVKSFKSFLNNEGTIKFEMDSTTTFQKEENENSNKMVSTLNKISSLLEELSSYVQANPSQTSNSTNNNNTTIINVASSQKNNLGVNIPG